MPNKEQQETVREIVKKRGWDGLRQQRSDLWQIILKQREEDRLLVDAYERML